VFYFGFDHLSYLEKYPENLRGFMMNLEEEQCKPSAAAPDLSEESRAGVTSTRIPKLFVLDVSSLVLPA
jgi:hypothetical protein